jgi:hypothetical protein
MTDNIARKLELVPEEGLKKKPELFYLYWLDTFTGKRYRAGVAFYQEEFLEYQLKLDVVTDGRPLYLKPSGSIDSRVNYRVESVVKRRDGRFLRRVEVGTGYSDSNTDNEVQIDLGPFSRLLVLDLKRNE